MDIEERKRIIIDRLNFWQTKMRLQHWTIDILWDEQPRDGALASIQPIDCRYWANLRISDDLNMEDEGELNNSIVHELIHLHCQRLGKMVEDSIERQSTEWQVLFKKNFEYEMELLADALANAFYPAK